MVAFAVVNSFYQYGSGIYRPTDCAGVSVNHAMQAVGFGVDASTNLPFALIRNTWGLGWGEQGYARVYLDPAVRGTCDLYQYNWWSLAGF